MIHHLLSHTDNADWLKVNQFFTQQVAYIAGKLDKIQEGERTALDNTMILYLSSMLHGGSHDCSQLPVVLRRPGRRPDSDGRTLDYLGKPNRKMCSLYLAMMDKMGVHLSNSAIRERGWRRSDNVRAAAHTNQTHEPLKRCRR